MEKVLFARLHKNGSVQKQPIRVVNNVVPFSLVQQLRTSLGRETFSKEEDAKDGLDVSGANEPCPHQIVWNGTAFVVTPYFPELVRERRVSGSGSSASPYCVVDVAKIMKNYSVTLGKKGSDDCKTIPKPVESYDHQILSRILQRIRSNAKLSTKETLVDFTGVKGLTDGDLFLLADKIDCLESKPVDVLFRLDAGLKLLDFEATTAGETISYQAFL